MILLDTSLWVELFGRAQRFRLGAEELLRVSTCLPVIQEVLQGVREESAHRIVREGMVSLPLLSAPMGEGVYLEGAEIYRFARKKGKTIRSSNDCLIAAIAIEAGIELWHADRDFEVLATFTRLQSVRKF
jgi:predicted nucleic acid-binding protein